MATILVVDDVADDVDVLERNLRRLGYEVVSALSGAEALAVAEARCPDVILLDVLMPHLDGMEVCRRLKASPTLQAIPVILVSALTQEEQVVRGLDAGAVDYISKPCNEAILAARVRSALRVKEANDTVQGTAQVQSDFLATTSDELRTPLASILEFANSLLEPDRSEDQRRAAIDNIRHSGDHLLQIIDDIRDLSEIQAGRLELEITDCSPIDIVADVATMMRRDASAKGIDLTVEYAGPIPEKIHSDPARLRQILLNLLSSAVKFSQRSSLGVRTQFLPREANESRLQFEVINTGSGLCDQGLQKLFRPYRQADSAATRRFGSAGLGLTISNQLTELLGGDMSVAYSSAEGCRVRVRVPTGALVGVALLDQPRATPIVEPRELVSPEAVPRLGECRILFAEDDPTTRKSVSGLLARAGAKVTIAVTGPAAVGLAMAADAARRPFDVVLMETHLSVLDGDSAIQLLRKRGYSRPIVALTDAALAYGPEPSCGTGWDDVVVKPIEPTRLVVAIRGQLATRSGHEKTRAMPELRG